MVLRVGMAEREVETEMEGDLDTDTEGVRELVVDTDFVRGGDREMVTVPVIVRVAFTVEEREVVVEGHWEEDTV